MVIFRNWYDICRLYIFCCNHCCFHYGIFIQEEFAETADFDVNDKKFRSQKKEGMFDLNSLSSFFLEN